MSYKEGDKFIIEIEEVYKSDLTSPDLYRVKGFNSLVFDNHGLNMLQKVEDTPAVKQILTDDEAEYLHRLIAPFRDRVHGIGKYSYGDLEHISIVFDVDECMSLPDFAEGTMYKGMEPGRGYKLWELDL